jgi:hypothetical protein
MTRRPTRDPMLPLTVALALLIGAGAVTAGVPGRGIDRDGLAGTRWVEAAAPSDASGGLGAKPADGGLASADEALSEGEEPGEGHATDAPRSALLVPREWRRVPDRRPCAPRPPASLYPLRC